mmetsp:Transcript_28709/g.77742  ORF Transcript_28709/g.77742 Transcript_28709/m.77742 type:complete len:213 (+) Transcript_28709:4647-5285(+)
MTVTGIVVVRVEGSLLLAIAGFVVVGFTIVDESITSFATAEQTTFPEQILLGVARFPLVGLWLLGKFSNSFRDWDVDGFGLDTDFFFFQVLEDVTDAGNRRLYNALFADETRVGTVDQLMTLHMGRTHGIIDLNAAHHFFQGLIPPTLFCFDLLVGGDNDLVPLSGFDRRHRPCLSTANSWYNSYAIFAIDFLIDTHGVSWNTRYFHVIIPR